MKEWFSLSEIAGSPNMPSKVSGVRRKAERECWQLRDRQAVGGGKEYHWASFSEETKIFLTDKFGDLSTNVDVAPVIDYDTKSQPLEKLEELANQVVAGNKNSDDKAFEMPVESDKSTAVTLARIEICRKAKEFWQESGLNKVAAYEQFVSEVNSGRIELAEFVKVGLQTKERKLKLSRASLTNWEAKNIKDLAPNHKGKDSFFDLRPDYAIAAEAVSREFGASAKILQHAFESGLIKEEFGLEDCPTYSQIIGWIRKQEETNKQRQRAFRTGDKSVLLPALGSYSRGLLPNQKWEIDSTKADLATKKENVVWLSSPFGEAPVRAALVACIDVATRMVKVLVRPTSNSEALCLVLADCVKDWGLPKLVKTDNGKDYISKHVKGFLAAMGIEQKCCVVRQPWEKPHIERFMRTLQHSAEWQMLPWSTGNSVAMQQALRKRREGDLVLPWTIAKFQEWIDKWVDSYHSRIHEGLGISPMARLASFRADGFVALMPKNLEETLLFAMMREDTVTVNKGGINYQGRFYVAEELVSHFGEKLAIKFDPEDVNQIIVYTTTDLSRAEFICKAKWNLALTPEEQARIASAKPAIAQAVQDHEKAVKSARNKIKREVAKNPERLIRGGGVAALKSVQEIEGTSANLISQIEAAAAPKSVEMSDSDRAQKQEQWNQIKADKEAEKSTLVIRKPQQWLAWWDNPETATAEDIEWMIRTIDNPYGGAAWVTMRQLNKKETIAILESRLAALRAA